MNDESQHPPTPNRDSGDDSAGEIEAGGESAGDGGEPSRRRFQRGTEDFGLWMRVVLFLVGWLLVLLGIAGLVLPGLQGIVTLLAGAAVLSLVSEVAYKSLRWCFQAWPRGWRKVATWRRSLRRRLMRWTGRDESPGADD